MSIFKGFFTKKTKKKYRFIDGIYFWKTDVRPKKKKYWLWLSLVPIFFCFLFLGRMSASYLLDSIHPFSLFRDGKYLILFQNNSEIRSAGGFIGSYAVMEMGDFEIKNLDFNTNIYSLDRQFAQSNYVEAPPPLAQMLKGETWALRDANYDASFPEASLDIMSFYEQETDAQVDGIIGINAKIIIDLLGQTGPIHLEKYNLTVSADNFYQVTQYQVEKAYFEEPENWAINEPKTFLKDLYPEILKKALDGKIDFLGFFKEELSNKDILLYFNDIRKQTIAQKHNWAGSIPKEQELKDLFKTNTPVDYLYINSNSYSGNKSSLSIKQEINYKLTQTDKYGQKMYQANLKINRIHGGSYVWPDGKNTEWLRIFVPENTQFLQAKLNEKDISWQIEVGSEAEKIYFGTEIVTEPGQANILEVEYLIPYQSEYHLLVQKQPGVVGNALTVNLGGSLLFDGILDRDKKI